MTRLTLINSKTVFNATLVVIPTLILIVYLSGLHEHRSLYLNSLLSTTILSVVFISFITTGLYNGWKLKHNWEKPEFKLETPVELPDLSGSASLGDADGEILGIIIAIIFWILIAIIGIILLWYLAGILWLTIISLAGLLYWIIFRAYRLIFKNSPKCKGNFIRSIGIAIFYTVLYNCWIYGIIFFVHYLNK